jgi:hypothetical protein
MLLSRIIKIFTLALAIIPITLSAQVANFVSWSIDAADLTNGKVVLQQPNTKTIHFKVTIQRFLQTGSSSTFQPVNFVLKLARIPRASGGFVDISSEGTFTSEVFGENDIMKTVDISLALKSAGTSSDIIQNNDEIVIRIKDATFPGGWATDNKTYIAIVNPSTYTPPPTPPIPPKPGPNDPCTLRASSDPTAPSNFETTLLNNGKVLLTWKDNSTEEFKLELNRKKLPDGPLVKFKLAANTTEYIDEAVSINDTYVYHVTSWINLGSGGSIGSNSNGRCATPVDCPYNLNYYGTSLYYNELKTGNSIDFINGIVSNKNALVAAGQSIRLRAGTHITASFLAKIEPCSPANGRTLGGNEYIQDGNKYIALAQANTNELETKLSVYPNPATNKITISLSASVTNDSIIEIYTMSGVLIKSSTIHAGESIKEIMISDIPSGFYYVVINNNGKAKHKKLIINH